MSNVKEFQTHVKELLEDKIGQETHEEWNSAMGKEMYAPKVDVAAGPYAINDGDFMNSMHIGLLEQHDVLFRRLAMFHLENVGGTNSETEIEERHLQITQKVLELRLTSENARCFVAIEIENKVSRKHLMGGAVNCSVLGKIGIAVGFTEEKHRCLIKLYRYFEFLRYVGKPTFNTANLLIITKAQLIEALTA